MLCIDTIAEVLFITMLETPLSVSIAIPRYAVIPNHAVDTNDSIVLSTLNFPSLFLNGVDRQTTTSAAATISVGY